MESTRMSCGSPSRTRASGFRAHVRGVYSAGIIKRTNVRFSNKGNSNVPAAVSRHWTDDWVWFYFKYTLHVITLSVDLMHHALQGPETANRQRMLTNEKSVSQQSTQFPKIVLLYSALIKLGADQGILAPACTYNTPGTNVQGSVKYQLGWF